jgi:Holliday junction resolvase
MAFANNRTRYEGELIKVLKENMGEEWFGQRGTHSLGVDVLFSHEGHQPFISHTAFFEVKSMKSWPFYLSKRNREQYDRYAKLFEEKKVEVIYGIRIVGGKGDKWRFAPLTGFSTTKNGHPKLGLEDTIGMQELCTLLKL